MKLYRTLIETYKKINKKLLESIRLLPATDKKTQLWINMHGGSNSLTDSKGCFTIYRMYWSTNATQWKGNTKKPHGIRESYIQRKRALRLLQRKSPSRRQMVLQRAVVNREKRMQGER